MPPFQGWWENAGRRVARAHCEMERTTVQHLGVCLGKVAGDGDLAKATLLHVEAEDECWPRWDQYFDAMGLSGSGQGNRTFSNYVQATQAAIAGMGVMLGWVSNSSDLLRQGQLAVFRDQPLFPDGAFHLVRPKHKEAKAAATTLARHLHRCVADVSSGK